MPAKVIVDANILVSAYGVDGEVRRHWRDSLGEYKIVISPEIFIEVEARLRNGEFSLSPDEIKSALREIAERCDFVRPSPPVDPRFEDSGAANIAALARHRFADGISPAFVLTGEDRLCAEGEIEGCKIVGIEQFSIALRQLQAT